MKCAYCGAEVPAGKNFCMWCGTRQTQPEPVAQLEPVVQPEPIPAPEMIPAEEEFPVIIPAEPAPAPVPVAAPKAAPVKTPDRPRRVPPRLQLPTERGLGKMFFLGIITLGIYPIVIWSQIVTELNIVASRYDGKRTMPYFAMVTLSPITLGIYALVWMHKFCHRIRDESVRRNTGSDFSPSDFWLWGVLGSLIIVGPFVFTHKLMKAMNKMNANYNVYG